MQKTTCSVSALALAALLSITPSQGRAEEPLSDCFAAVGTFLTKNTVGAEQAGPVHSRSLLSFTNGGHAFRNDSDQDAGQVRLSFGDSRGAWRCDGKEGSKVKLSAVMLNFTYPGPNHGRRLIGRLDYNGTYDTADETLRLSALLSFVPIDGDPLGPRPSEGIPVTIVGKKIEVPASD